MLSGGRDGNDALDGHELFPELDVAGWDCYPQQFAAHPPAAQLGMLHTIARGYRQQRYWMLEQQSGSPMGMVADDPRRIRLWSWQSVAHGASLLLYFNWRTFPFGHEQYWRGILDHDGEPGRRFEVVRRTAAEIRALNPWLARLEWRNRAAIFFDHDSATSLSLAPPGAGLSMREEGQRWFSALTRHGLGADAVFDPGLFSGYEIVVTPLCRMGDPRLAEALREFVRRGGTWVATPLVSSLNRDHVALAERPPYWLREVLGVERVEWGSLSALAGKPKELRSEASPREFSTRAWAR